MTTERSFRIGEMVLGGCVLALGIFIAIDTLSIKAMPGSALTSARLFPFLVAGGLILIGAGLLWEGARGHVAYERGFDLDWPSVWLVLAGLAIQILVVGTLGWIVATTLLFVATAAAFGSRRFVVDAIVGVLVIGLTFVLFDFGLGLRLPGGSLLEGLLRPSQIEAR